MHKFLMKLGSDTKQELNTKVYHQLGSPIKDSEHRDLGMCQAKNYSDRNKTKQRNKSKISVCTSFYKSMQK